MKSAVEFSDIGKLTIKGGRIETTTGLAMSLDRVGRASFDKAEIVGESGALRASAVNELLLRDTTLIARPDQALVQEIIAAVEAEGLSGEALAERYAERLKPTGIDLWEWVDRAGSVATIVQTLAALALLAPSALPALGGA